MVSYATMDSPILGTAIGLVLLFATTALLCSGVVETISNILQVRAKYLLTGLRAMLDDPGATVSLRGKGVHNDVKDPETVKAVAAEMRPYVGRVADPSTTVSDASGDGSSPTVATDAPDAGPPAVVPTDTPDAGSSTVADPSAAAPQAAPTEAPVPNLTTAIFESPLLRSLQSRRVGPPLPFLRTVRNPQYVSAPAFARAFVDFLVPPTVDGQPQADKYLEQVRAAVTGLPPQWPVRDQLLAYLARAGTVGQFEQQLGQWYDEQMGKISGWYKRWSRLVLGIVGFAVAVLANVDTLAVAHSLYVDAPLQQAVVATADSGSLCQTVADVAQRNTCTAQALDALRAGGVPLGWPAPAPSDGWGYLLKGLGWAITAFAVSFGAPFWFEALSKLGSLRNTGTRPQDAATYPAPR